MNLDYYTSQLQFVIKESERFAQNNGFKYVTEDILFYSLISSHSSTCILAFEKAQINIAALAGEAIKSIILPKKHQEFCGFSKKAKSILKFAEAIAASQFRQEYLSPEIVLLAFFSQEHLPKALKNFFKVSLTEEILENPQVLSLFEGVAIVVKDLDFSIKEEVEPENEDVNNIPMFELNPILSQFSDNLNLQAAIGLFDTIVDFDSKIDEIATILCRKKKPNAILVGPAGTGKTSLVQGLATKIVKGEAPDLLLNKVIYSVNLSSMVAGTQYRGQFEKRLEDFINEAKKYSNLILFIDEIHTLVGAGGGSSSSLEASNILKPELARGSISCIGATTINEYTNTIKKDSALDRRFEKVIVREPSKFQMEKILPEILNYYEEFHGVEYTEEFVNNIIYFCEQFLPNRRYPDKAIDVIDHCGAQAKVKFWEMDAELKDYQKHIREGIEETGEVDQKALDLLNKKIDVWEGKLLSETAKVQLSHLKAFFLNKGNPLNRIEIIDSLIKELGADFVGNKKTILAFSKAMRLSTLGINKKDNNAVPDLFLVSGGHATGKTLFCSLLQQSLEKMGSNVLVYNGTQLSDGYAPWKILSPQNNNASLAEKILMYPNSIIIIDDFDKIHLSCESLFSQIFKEGFLQMHNGEIADFSNCKFILTSSIKKSSEVGFNTRQEEIPNLPSNFLKFLPNRFFLCNLSKRELRRILFNRLKQIQKNCLLKGIQFNFDFGFIKKFVDDNYKKEESVNILNKAIEEKLISKISEQMLKGETIIQL